ncbi:MAG: hypothetical protein IJM79_01680 [Erysipelotrichaceae bacterium]|nr:hypothetical protein [Erysipelotrichaceae bacterium]
MDPKQRVREFLAAYRQLPEYVDLKKYTDSMLQQMQLGLDGEEASLMMIPTYLSSNGAARLGEPVIAIDAGGTNLRTALVCFDENGRMQVSDLAKQPMLGVESELTKDEFIEGICQLVMPLLEKTDKIGFCFSFPCEIQPDKDGKIIRFNKDVKISGSEGTMLGSEMKKWFREHGVEKEISIAILNDTVATLLGGPAIRDSRAVDGQIGLIVGTGSNTAYSENNEKITKAHLKEAGSMIINMESANFDRFEMGEFEKRMDQASGSPGVHPLEKCISGLYLGHVIGQTILQASKEGLFSAGNKIAELPEFSMSRVDAFMRDPYGDNLLANACGNEEDVEVMYQFIEQAMDRAARLITVNLAACIVKMDGGRKASAPARIVVEGTTILKGYSYFQRLDYFMRQFVTNELGRHYQFVTADDANLAGSAIAVLLNS